jgi:DNA-binding transcriptional ArsR family regulator
MLDADFLAAIGHPARLRALIFLEQEPAETQAVAAHLGLGDAEAEDHLRHLAETGLIDAEDGAGSDPGPQRWRTRATGWAALADLLVAVAGDTPGRGP